MVLPPPPPPSRRSILLILILIRSSFTLSSSQPGFPLNIETTYPTSPTPIPAPTPSPSSPAIPTLPSSTPPSNSSSSTSKKSIIAAVSVTAASTLVLAFIAFFVWIRCARTRTRTRTKYGGGGRGGSVDADEIGSSRFLPAVPPQTEFARFDGNLKGLIVDEDGLDVLYWRKLEGSSKHGLRKEPLDRNRSTVKPPIPRGKSSSSANPTQIHPENLNESVPRERNGNQVPPPSLVSENITPTSSPPPPPPPPPATKKSSAPPPIPSGAGPSRPPSKLIGSKTVSAAAKSGEQGSVVKLKPLHWDKVNVNTNHSMVWDKIDKGSFQYNGDMMEALFGVVATNRKSPNTENKTEEPSSNAKTFILDPRKSQNTAIILKSLEIPREELIDALKEGTKLHPETLEKLSRIAPTAEEESNILAFNGDPTNLADAEYFLYHLLKALPDAFTRANTMLFRTNYDYEILGVKESLLTLESACNELRSRGIFLKLLEAILKAGNRLNAGTVRGDAQAFNLTTLLKLSDYKSSDGKTTLLHFVVHEVVRNEGKRCVLNRTNSGSRGYGTRQSTDGGDDDDSVSKEDKEKEFLKLGLPVVGGLRAQFSEVKKAAGLDYNALANTLSSLSSRVAETRELVVAAGWHSGGYLNKINGFLAAAELELEEIKEEHTKAMDLVKRTTQYYQAGASNDKIPLQLFIIVKEFLGMVDRTCVDIARSLQQQQRTRLAPQPGGEGSGTGSGIGSPSSQPEVLRTRVTFPRLPDHFLSDRSANSSRSNSSEEVS